MQKTIRVVHEIIIVHYHNILLRINIINSFKIYNTHRLLVLYDHQIVI